MRDYGLPKDLTQRIVESAMIEWHFEQGEHVLARFERNAQEYVYSGRFTYLNTDLKMILNAVAAAHVLEETRQRDLLITGLLSEPQSEVFDATYLDPAVTSRLLDLMKWTGMTANPRFFAEADISARMESLTAQVGKRLEGRKFDKADRILRKTMRRDETSDAPSIPVSIPGVMPDDDDPAQLPAEIARVEADLLAFVENRVRANRIDQEPDFDHVESHGSDVAPERRLHVQDFVSFNLSRIVMAAGSAGVAVSQGPFTMAPR